VGLIKVTNNLSAAPTTIAGTWDTYKQNAENFIKKLFFWVFIIIITIVIIKLIFWIYKYAMKKHLNNEIGKLQAVLQSNVRQQQFAAPPYYAPQPYYQ
jgi:uncharacterized membrane protein